MKIVVFGSTGKTGQEVIKLALERGYEVHAYARNPKKINMQHHMFHIYEGDLNDMNKMKEAMKHTDAVISLLGPMGKVKDKRLSNGIQNIMAAMKEQNVSRFIQITTATAHDSNDKRDLKLGFIIGILKLTQKKLYNEIITISNAVRSSNLNWTLVRAPFLNNDTLTKHLRVGYVGDKYVKHSLSRDNLAWFMLEQVEDTNYIKKAPFISD